MNKNLQQAFTLLEMTLVLVIFSVVLGGMLRPLLNNREQLLQSRLELQMTAARNALLGFAARHGRLPCPATPSSAGEEASSSSGCQQYSGFLPVVSLGLAGPLDADVILLDPWSGRIVYSLSASDSDADGIADFAVDGGMRNAGLSRLAGDLKVFHWESADCSTLQLRASHVVAVIYSNGKSTHTSKAEKLNQAMGKSYATGAFSQSVHCGFDDRVQWLSDSALFTQMLRAQRLP